MAWNDIRKPCIDKDLEARNRQILYPKHQIPASDFSEELESFHQHRKRVFTEINPIETRLDIPGRIIHLVRSSDKYVPHWASLLSIRDIELSLKGIVSCVLWLHIICPLFKFGPNPKVFVIYVNRKSIAWITRCLFWIQSQSITKMPRGVFLNQGLFQ